MMVDNRMSKLRKKLLLCEESQYKVAAACGIHPSTLSQYSLRRMPILPHHIVALCRYFKCQQEDIVGVLDEPDIINWIDEKEMKNDSAHV